MSVIKLHTANERLIFDDKPMLTSGNIGIDSISVSFCDCWKQLGDDIEFWAAFFKDENEPLKVKLDNGECKIPSEMLIEKGAFYFGVYAENANCEKVKTSVIVKYCVGQGITTKGEAESNLIKAATAELKADLDRIKATHADTSVITDYTSFFSGGLRSEIIGKVDTSNALKVTSMYYNCDTLEEIPPMNTSKCKNFNTVFYNCSSLKTAPVLDTSNGESFNSMFYGCKALEAPPNYDTGKAEDLGSMFRNCEAMSGVITLDTKNCTAFSSAFANCVSLEEINFTDTSSVVQWVATFQGCTGLHTINNLSIAYGGYNNNLFYNCIELRNVTFVIVKVKDNNFTLTSSTKLTVESLDSLATALVDNTGGTTYTIKLGSENIAKLSDATKQIISDKNYKYS